MRLTHPKRKNELAQDQGNDIPLAAVFFRAEQ